MLGRLGILPSQQADLLLSLWTARQLHLLGLLAGRQQPHDHRRQRLSLQMGFLLMQHQPGIFGMISAGWRRIFETDGAESLDHHLIPEA